MATHPYGRLTGAVRAAVRRTPGITARQVWLALPYTADVRHVATILQKLKRQRIVRAEPDATDTYRRRFCYFALATP